jgi:hypothetical protein
VLLCIYYDNDQVDDQDNHQKKWSFYYVINGVFLHTDNIIIESERGQSLNYASQRGLLFLSNWPLSNSQEPSTADSQEPSTAGSQEPSTADSQEPSTADNQEPSTADSPEPSMADSQEPSMADSQELL